MEEFEGLTSIVAEFGIKGSTLNLFYIRWKTPNSDKELTKFVQLPYGPHNKAFPNTPIIIDTNGNELKYCDQEESENKSILEYDDSKFDSDVELNESSISTNLTKFMNEYNIKDDVKVKNEKKISGSTTQSNILSDIILDSNCDDMLETHRIISSDFTKLSSNNWDSDPSTKLRLASEKEDLPSLKSEPFADLESDNFEDLHG